MISSGGRPPTRLMPSHRAHQRVWPGEEHHSALLRMLDRLGIRSPVHIPQARLQRDADDGLHFRHSPGSLQRRLPGGCGDDNLADVEFGRAPCGGLQRGVRVLRSRLLDVADTHLSHRQHLSMLCDASAFRARDWATSRLVCTTPGPLL